MKIIMSKGVSLEDVQKNKWDIAFVGRPIDDRGKAIVSQVHKHANEVIELFYDANNMTLTINTNSIQIKEFNAAVAPYFGKKIILESTTLGVPELIIGCDFFTNQVKTRSFDLLYFEPREYRRQFDADDVMSFRNYSLSTGFLGFKGIPGYSFSLESARNTPVVFSLVTRENA